MDVKILEVSADELKGALIRAAELGELPSIHDEWRFNFSKQLQKLSNASGFILVAKDTPTIIEGCLIFQLKEEEVPYIAFLEVAPHNRGENKKYDYVAGCLIAFAFKQTFIKGKKDYKGILFFDVLEDDEKTEKKLMRNYAKKYNAMIWKDTTMVIADDDGEDLVTKYLPGI